jgi:hypothetical protein
MSSKTLVSVLCACAALLSAGGVAFAQSDTVTEKGGPSRAMLVSGLATFGISYGAAALVAASSDLNADHRLFVPIAGPWMALSDRGGCGAGTPRSCNAATTNQVLIIADGVFQALGALLVVESFLNPETITTRRASAEPPQIHLAPTFGANGYGLSAFGSF